MTSEHKAALAVGRDEGRAVKRYLEALESQRPKRGRKVTNDTLKKRLDAVERELPGAEPLRRLHLIQERLDLQNRLSAGENVVDISSLESGFVKVAKSYGQRKGITYSAWREAGVSAATLKRAGIDRGAR